MILYSHRKMLGAAMAWRQGQSYSEDLRGRVLAAVDGGMAARAAASVFRVSVSYIYKALIRRRRTGEASARRRKTARMARSRGTNCEPCAGHAWRALLCQRRAVTKHRPPGKTKTE